MDSVRYLFYYYWKESKGDISKCFIYYQKLLENVEIFELNVGVIDKQIIGYLDVIKFFCGVGFQLVEFFLMVLKEILLLEIF